MAENIDKRIKILNSVLTNKKDQDAVEKAFFEAKGDWTTISESLKDKLPEEKLQKVSFAHSLADWSNDNVELVKTLAEQPVKSKCDSVLLYNSYKQRIAMVETRNLVV